MHGYMRTYRCEERIISKRGREDERSQRKQNSPKEQLVEIIAPGIDAAAQHIVALPAEEVPKRARNVKLLPVHKARDVVAEVHVGCCQSEQVGDQGDCERDATVADGSGGVDELREVGKEECL